MSPSSTAATPSYFSRLHLFSVCAVVMFLLPGGSVSAQEGSSAESAATGAPDSEIQRGKYLALAGNCASCHTTANGAFMAGGLAFDTPFGTLYSTNITPDTETGIGSWTGDEFLASMRAGVRPNGDHLYPVFPYTAFTKVIDEDVAAIFAYLKSIPAVSQKATENDISFPYSMRSLMFFWKSMFFTEGAYEADDGQSEQWNRGAYLVDALTHCSACHSPRNFLGAEDDDMAMTGGEYKAAVRSHAIRTWSAPNLTGSRDGLGAWPVEEITAYLKTGRNSFVETFGPMNEVIQNSTRHLSESDVVAMSVYLKSLPANDQDRGAAADDDVIRMGMTMYNVHCGTCHLPTGLGDAESGASLAGGSLVVRASNPASLINVILYAPELPDPPLPTVRREDMHPFGDLMSDEEIAALATYLRSSWGNTGGLVTAKQVAAQR